MDALGCWLEDLRYTKDRDFLVLRMSEPGYVQMRLCPIVKADW